MNTIARDKSVKLLTNAHSVY